MNGLFSPGLEVACSACSAVEKQKIRCHCVTRRVVSKISTLVGQITVPQKCGDVTTKSCLSNIKDM